MANEIRANIDVRGEQVAAAKLKRVGDAAEKAGDSLEELGGTAVVAGKATESAGDDMRDAANDADFLNRKVEELSGSYKALIRQLNSTGDTSLLKDIGRERRELNKFKSLTKELLPEPAEVSKAGASVGSMLMTAVTAGARAGGPALTGVLVAAGVTAAPGLAATVASAVVGGVGVGGIAGGIALAAQDPAVQAAGEHVGAVLLSQFEDAADGFVRPVIDSLGKIGNAGWANKLAPTFDRLAAKVEPVADGLLELVDNALPGIEAAGKAAGPVLDSLATGLPRLGSAVGDFFESVSDDPEALATALDLFIDVASTAITVAGDVIETLIGIYSVSADVAQALGIITEEEDNLIKYTGGANDALAGFAENADEAAKEAQALESAIASLFGQVLGVNEATIAYEQAVDDLKAELTDGKRTLDENTQAGRDNWQAINDQARAIEDLRQANIANKMPLADANALYEKQFEQLRKTLLGLGYNKKAVDEYIDRLKNIPKSVKTTVLIDAFASNAVTAILAGAGKVAGKRASGGPVYAGRTYLVGEQGPELLTMGATGGHVSNAHQTAQVMSGASGGSAASGPLQIELIHRWEGPGGAAGDVGEALAKWIRTDVKVRGGGSVVAAYDER